MELLMLLTDNQIGEVLYDKNVFLAGTEWPDRRDRMERRGAREIAYLQERGRAKKEGSNSVVGKPISKPQY